LQHEFGLKTDEMTQIFKNTALLIAVILGLLSPAKAVPVPVNAVMQATYSGVILNGTDSHNIFGGSILLDGEAFIASFTYNTAIGRHTSPVFDKIYGGLAFGSQL
jgi:hypothetical protein